jgi:hypothetical protein
MNREAIEAECKDWIDYGVEYRWSEKLIAFLRSVQALLRSPAVDRGPVNTSRDTYAPAEPSGELREKVANILYIETDKYYPGIYGIADRILAAIFDEPKEATHE